MAKLPYRNLEAWQIAHALAMDVLDLAERPALARRFYFRDQLCSAAMSIPANIAEGRGRSRPLDYASFVDRARASLFELDTWLYTAARRGYCTEQEYETFAATIERLSAMLLGLIEYLRSLAGEKGPRAAKPEN